MSPVTTPPTTNPWVAMWSLDGGVALAYRGAWAAGSYQPGDMVVDGGVLYQCVRQTVKKPTPWPIAAAVTYGTTLPANPIDGQEAVLVDNVTNPSYQWRFRFNASSSSAYKWEYVGGAPYVYPITTLASWTAINQWAVLIGWPAPRAGDYLVRPTFHVALGGTAGQAFWVYVGVGVNNSVIAGVGTDTRANGGAWVLMTGAEYTITGTPAGAFVQTMGYIGIAAQANSTVAGMTITPKRVA